MSLTQEQVPLALEDEVREFLARRFVEISNELDAPSKFKERKEMPYKPQTGDVHYFGNPATHNYDAAITDEGFWGLTSAGWLGLDSVSGGGAPITSVFGRVGIVVAEQADYDGFFLTPAEGDAAYLGIAAKAADSELLDGIDSLNFARTDIAEIFTQNVTFDGDIRGSSAVMNLVNSSTGALAIIDMDFLETTEQLDIRYMRDTNSSGTRRSRWYKGDGTSTVSMLLNHETGDLTLAGTVDGRDVDADGTKLDGIEPLAEVNVVDSVFGRTGIVVALQADYDSFFLTPAEGDAAYLAIGAKAADSELLDGVDGSNYARTDIAETFVSDVEVESLTISDGGIDRVIRFENGSGAVRGTITSFVSDGRFEIDGVNSTLRLLTQGNTALFIDASQNLLPAALVDGRDIDADGTKLDTIETDAKDDQTAGEIEAIVSHDNLQGVAADEHFLQSAISIPLSQISDSGALAALNTVGTTEIDNDAVNFDKMQNIPTLNVLGRVTGGTGNTEDLTATQVTTILNNFTDALKGLAPPSGGGSTNFLRADGVWNAPAGSGGNVSNSGTPLNDQIPIWTNASTIEGDPDLTFNGSALTVGVASATTIVSRIAAVDGFKLIPGLSVGGWARGLVVRKFSDDARIAGTGFLGSAESLTSWHVGFGATWWSGADLAMTINASTKLATFEGNIALTGSGTVDGRNVSADGIVLDDIESGRTWDNS